MNFSDLNFLSWILDMQTLTIFVYGSYVIYRLLKKCGPDPKDCCFGEEFGKQLDSFSNSTATFLCMVLYFLLLLMVGHITLHHTSNKYVLCYVLITFNSILLGYFIVRHIRELK